LSVLIEWSPYQKLYSTYLKGFEAAVKPDGRLHTQITKCGTATGRTASSGPALQNIPKRNKDIMRAIRGLLVAPVGKVLVSADYSQSELRWIAQESCEPEMVHIFKTGQDMHVITGQSLAKRAGYDWESLSDADRDKYRQNAKPVNFGFPYGQSAPGFQAYARDNYGVRFTLREAEMFRETFLHVKYRGLLPWHDTRRQEARDNGFVRSAYGFIRRIPNIKSREHDKRGEAERIAVNTGIQSASNDSTLLAALEARRSGLVDDKRAQLVLFIHDELIYAVDEDYVAEFVPGLIAQMRNIPTERFGFSLRVPLIADAKVGRTLADMKTYEV
jgi:DNA polymerase-1